MPRKEPVAPRAGAWIETSWPCNSTSSVRVAPRAGAWIETSPESNGVTRTRVAPRAGAWIETMSRLRRDAIMRSRSPRGSVDRNSPAEIARMTGVKSLPARERGSKRFSPGHIGRGTGSLPARERGSKPQDLVGTHLAQGRSPRGSVDRNALELEAFLQ